MTAKLNYAVFNLETKFRITEYKTRNLAILDYNAIIRDQPNLKDRIAVRPKEYEQTGF